MSMNESANSSSDQPAHNSSCVHHLPLPPSTSRCIPVPPRSRIKDGLSALSAALTLAVTAAAFAIQPAQWTHTTQADFEPGESEGIVVTNLGDVKLASSTATVGTMPEGVNIIYDMRLVANGDLYIAAGPGGQLLRRRGDQITQVAALENEHIYALDQTADGGLLLAISGTTSRLAILDGDQLKTVVDLPGIRYIWDTIVDGNDVYLATGPDGKLLHVNMSEAFNARARPAPAVPAVPVVPKKDDEKNGKDKQPDKAASGDATAITGVKELPLPTGVRVLLDTVQANLLCLGRDKQGRLFVGTDTDGLVYRVTLSPTGEVDPFVLYDAAEPEIFTLLVTADGTVYVGTADAEQARPGRMEAASEKEGGRPTPVPQPVPANPDLPITPKPDPKATKPAATTGTDAPKPDATATTPADAPKNPDGTGDSSAPDTQLAGVTNEPTKEPTQEQYDQLRNEIRTRLTKARQTGEMQAGPSTPRSTIRRTTGPALASARSTTGAAKQGNAVYRIDTAGFVTEVFRESALILKLLDDGDKLLVATGAEGQLYRIDIAAEETTIIADLEPEQIPALIKGTDGKILVGTGSPAMLVRLDEGFAGTGSYTSPVLDATQISLWGKLMLTAAIPEGTSVSVQTRSGNVQDPERANWSKWSVPRNLTSDDAVGPLTPREVAIVSPPARFMQYRLTLTGTGKSTSVVDRVSLAYVVPNLRPAVTTVRAIYPNELKPGAKPAARNNNNANENPLPELSSLNVEWEANDPNGDQLRYTLEYRMAGSDKWLPLMEDITTTTYEWNTKRVPDGRYILRVTATDAPDNPATMAKTVSRQSDPILIDNTPPTIGDRQTRVQNQSATITATVSDSLSPIRLVQYAVDNTGKWHAVLPDDLIFDSTKETITVKIADLSTGSHVITLRGADMQGNTRYVAETVEIK